MATPTSRNRFANRAASFAVICASVTGISAAHAVTLTLDLGLLPTTSVTNRLDIAISTSGLSDSELTRLSGNVLSTIDYDIVSGLPRVNTIEFTGGTININGASTNNVELTLDGGFLGRVDIDGIGIRGELDTPLPPSFVTNGAFATEDHFLKANQGTLVVDGTGLFSSADTTLDLAANVVELTQVGQGTIAIQQVGVNGLNRTFQATLTLPVDAEDTIPVTDGITATLSGVGNITARTNFIVAFPFEGDYNGNGIVDAADYAVWRDSQGRTGVGLAADGNFDLVVNTADYNLWVANFGDTPPGSGGAAAIPEPTSFALASFMATLLLAIGRGRRGFQFRIPHSAFRFQRYPSIPSRILSSSNCSM